MHIYFYKDHRLTETDSLISAAGLAGWKHPAAAVAGAGGKTSIIRRLAGEYIQAGRKVVVTTTTHISDEELPWFLREPSEEKLRQLLEQWKQVWVGIPGKKERLAGVPQAFYSKICSMELPVLIEADGARMLPMKCPGPREPVIPENTTHVLSVYGLDAVGRRLCDVCFRPERAAQILNKKITEPVTAEDIGRLAASEMAGRKGCPDHAVYTVILNKADNRQRRQLAEEIAAEIADRGIGRIAAASLTDGKQEAAETDENID